MGLHFMQLKRGSFDENAFDVTSTSLITSTFFLKGFLYHAIRFNSITKHCDVVANQKFLESREAKLFDFQLIQFLHFNNLQKS